MFQLTTSRKGRQTSRSMYDLLWYFNSRPHEEVDMYYIACGVYYGGISTHDLTKRSTLLAHYLPFQNMYFNSRPREEVDCLQRHWKYSPLPFQLTTSRGGRRFALSHCASPFVISTHDLTRRSTILYRFESRLKWFQLTTSRGGRQGYRFAHSTGENISTHDLTRRSTSTR